MAFSGDLNTVSLADIFQQIALNQMTGTLSVLDEDTEKKIFFSHGEIGLVTLGERRRVPLGKLLVGRGIVPEIEMQKILQEQKSQPGKKIGELLLEKKLVTQDDVDRALRFQVEEELFDLFVWKNANFKFDPGTETPPEFADQPALTGVKVNTQNVVMEACRRIDEWERIKKVLPSTGDVLALKDPGKLSEISDEYRVEVDKVIHAMNGERDVKELSLVTFMSGFGVAQICAALISLGAVAIAPPDHIRQLAQEAVKEGDFGRAMQRYHRLLEMIPSDEEARTAIPECLLGMQRMSQAKRAFEAFLTEYLAADQLDRALAVLEKIIACEPENLQWHVQRLELLEKTDAKSQAIETGQSLLGKINAKEQYPLALSLCSIMLRCGAEPIALKRRMIKYYQELGEVLKAAELMREVGEIYLRSGKSREAAELFEQAIALNPDDENSKRFLKGMKSQVAQKSNRKRVLWIFLIVFLPIAGLAAAFQFGYVPTVKKFYQEKKLESAQALKEKKFTEAKAVLSSIKVKYYLVGWILPNLENELIEIDRQNEEYSKLSLEQTKEESKKAMEQGQALSDLKLSLDKGRVSSEEGIKQLIELDKEVIDPDLKKRVAELLDTHRKIAKSAQDVFNKAKGFENAKMISESREQYLKLGRNFPNTDLARDARIPVQLTVTPSDAEIFLDGVKVTEKSGYLTVRLLENGSLREKAVLTAKKDGYASAEVSFNPATEESITKTLKRMVEPLWQTQVGKAIGAPLGLSKQSVAVAAREGVVKIIAMESGQTEAEYNMETPGQMSDLVATPLFVNNILIVPGPGISLAGIDLAQKKIAWRATTPLSVKTAPLAGKVADLQDRQVVFIADNGGNILAFNPADGNELWSKKLEPNAGVPPCLRGELLLYADKAGTVTALLASTGDESWSADMETGSAKFLICTQENVIVGGKNQKVHCQVIKGPKLWTAKLEDEPLPGADVYNSPNASGSLLFCADKSGNLYGIDRETGTVLWKSKLDRDPVSPPIYSNALVYIATDDNKVSGLVAKTGKLVWQFQSREVISTPLVISGTKLFFGTKNGMIHAVKLQ